MPEPLMSDELIAVVLALDTLPPQTLVLSASVIFTLISQCQLALRHPHNSGISAQTTREWIERVARYLDHQVPGTYQMIQMGFDGRYDVPCDDAE